MCVPMYKLPVSSLSRNAGSATGGNSGSGEGGKATWISEVISAVAPTVWWGDKGNRDKAAVAALVLRTDSSRLSVTSEAAARILHLRCCLEGVKPFFLGIEAGGKMHKNTFTRSLCHAESHVLIRICTSKMFLPQIEHACGLSSWWIIIWLFIAAFLQRCDEGLKKIVIKQQ